VDILSYIKEENKKEIIQYQKEKPDCIMTKLFQSQGYNIVDILDREKREKSKFLKTMNNEIHNITDDYNFIVFSASVNLKDFYDFYENEKTIRLKDPFVGLFNPIHGGGSLLDVELEQPFEYQYKKTFNRQYSNWTEWHYRTYNPNAKPNFGYRELEEIVDLGYREVTKYNYVQAKPIYNYVNKEFKTVRERSCDGFRYYRNETTKTTSTTKTVHETSTEITRVETRVTDSYVTRKGSEGSERYVGMVSLSSPPTNTLSARYEFVGMDFARCGNCTTTPYTIWKKYVRTVGKSQKVDTITRTYYKDHKGQPTTRIKSQNTTTNVNVTYSGVSVACNLVEDETTLFVKVKELAGFEKQRVAYTTRDYSYKYRNRTIISQGYVDYKWSYYNDQNLINSGYVMTGNKRVKN